MTMNADTIETTQQADGTAKRASQPPARQLKEPDITIAIIGTGYVGLVTAACLAGNETKIICVDHDRAKLKSLQEGKSPIYEPGIEQLLRRALKRNLITFEADIARAAALADAVIIAVGTPTDPVTHAADLSAVFDVAAKAAKHMKPNAFLITKSTVPPGTNRWIAEVTKETCPGKPIHIISNPEFLREGQAISDFMNPDRIVVGADSTISVSFMTALYRRFSANLFITSIESAEIIKYAANAFLATKIAFINEISDLCERAGADIGEVSKGIGLDQRIAPHFLNAGPGYGGSCFPKDTLALIATGETLGAPQTIVAAASRANHIRKSHLATRIEAALGSLRGRRVAILGLAFKPGTDDLRDAPSLDLIPALIGKGSEVTIHDPKAPDHPAFDTAIRVNSPLAATKMADAIILLTDWPQYQDLPFWEILHHMRGNLIVDFRNALDGDELRAIGFSYLGIGQRSSRPVGPKMH